MTRPSAPLVFATQAAASEWLRATGHIAIVYQGSRGWLLLQFHDGQPWAFSSEQELASLPDW
jgi:hypothetical protein